MMGMVAIVGVVVLALVILGGLGEYAFMSNDPIELAKSIIKQFEGSSLKAYPDPPGQTLSYSIGYGHHITGADGLSSSSVITTQQQEDLLTSDMQVAVDCVTSKVTISMTPKMEAALISFCYNEGCEAFSTSTLLSVVNSGDNANVAAQFMRWVFEHVNGALVESTALEARRSQEADLFNQGVGDLPSVVTA